MFTYLLALMSSDLGILIVILIVPRYFDIRAREWPLRVRLLDRVFDS